MTIKFKQGGTDIEEQKIFFFFHRILICFYYLLNIFSNLFVIFYSLPTTVYKRPSLIIFFLANFLALRTASAFSLAFLTEGFSKCCLSFISLKTPSLCNFFLSALKACSILLSLTFTCTHKSL